MTSEIVGPIGSIDINDALTVNDSNMIAVRGWCLPNNVEPPVAGEVYINNKKNGPDRI